MKSLLASALLLAATAVFSQQPGSIDPTFTPLANSAYGYGVTSHAAPVTHVAKQPDGKLLVAGYFYSYNNIAAQFLVRLNADGSRDMSFDTGSGPNYWVETIVPLPNGKILIGGNFNEYNGTALDTRMVMLNADGSIDTSFTIGDTNQAGITDIKVQPDGKFLVAGFFDSFDGYPQKRIVRLNEDGTVDTSFSTGTGPNGNIVSIALQPDGKIMVGGNFTSINGTSRNRVARLNADGSLDTTFNPGSGFDAPITDMLLQPDGKIVIGGYFYNFQGVARNGAVRVNSSGSIDATFDPGNELFGLGLKPALNSDGNVIMVSADGMGVQTLNADGTVNQVYPLHGNNEAIYVIKLLDNGKIFIGGDFKRAGNLTRQGVAVLNADFTPDATFNSGTGPEYPIVRTIELPDGKKLICGAFTAYNDITSKGIARLTQDGETDPTFLTDDISSRIVQDMQVHADGKITIAGSFYDGTTFSRIAQLNSDGTTNTNFMPGTGPNDVVHCLQILQSGKMLVGGYFNQYNGIARNSLARINEDGSLDTTFNANLSSGFYLRKMIEMPDGKIIIASTGIIQRLNANGLSDFTFNAPAWVKNSLASGIKPTEDGKLLVTGRTSENNNPYIVRLNADGTVDDTFNFFDPPVNNQYVNESVIVTGVQPDGKILVYMSDQEGMQLVRINQDGSLDESFDAGTGTLFYNGYIGDGINEINSYVTFQADGKILVSGEFGTFSGALKRHIVRLVGFEPAALEMDAALETAYCAGETLQIPFTASGDYGVGNVFTAQLSDADGSFINPAVIGNATLSESGTIEALIPADTPAGTGYKIRLIASYPALETESAATTFTVYNTPAPSGAAQQTIVEGSAGTTTIADIDVTGEGIAWYASEEDALSGTAPLSGNDLVVSGQTYYATQTLNGCTSATALAVTVNTILTINDFAAMGITLHPNPVVDVLNITAKEDITDVAVYNMLGQQVRYTWNSTNNTLNMDGLQAGNYVVKVTVGNTMGNVLVVKK